MAKRQSSRHEDQLLMILNKLSTEHTPIREYRFHSGPRTKPDGSETTYTKWRFDFAYPTSKIAFEVEGGTWMPRSGHTHPISYAKDCEKYNYAAKLGWTVYRLTPEMINEDYVQELLYAPIS